MTEKSLTNEAFSTVTDNYRRLSECIENAKLKEQNSKMESVLKKAEDFLKGKGLYELFQNFVLGIGRNKSRNKDGLE